VNIRHDNCNSIANKSAEVLDIELCSTSTIVTALRDKVNLYVVA